MTLRAPGALLVLLLHLCGCGAPPSPEPGAESEHGVSAPKDGALVRGRAPRASGGFASVVILTPVDEHEFPVPSEPALLDQFNTSFHPSLLVVRAGQLIEFKNSEDTLHNVHVVDRDTKETAFNVATPVQGSYDYQFDEPAVYDVSCGIHPSMAAFIVVTESPFTAEATSSGEFELQGVPPGRYTARVWNLDPSRRSERVVVIEAPVTELVLDEMA